MFQGADPLLMLSVVLIAGLAGGFAVRRIRLPGVTGQILVGILIGPSVLDVFGLQENHDSIERMRPVTHFALGLIAVAVGSHLQIRRLRNAFKRLGILLCAEATVTPAVVFAVLLLVPDIHWTTGLLLAALAISTAPATIVAIVRESRARGVFVKTLVAAVALNNIACILCFEVAHSVTRVHLAATSDGIGIADLIAPFSELLSTALLGGGVGLLLVAVTWKIVRSDLLATASLIAILLTSGLADYFAISPLLSCLFLGVSLANLTPEKEEIGNAVFSDFEVAILAAFFTLAGMDLKFDYLISGGLLALLLVGARLAGKVLSGGIAMTLAGATKPVRRYLGLGLIPQAGVAIGLMIFVAEDPDFAPIRGLFIAIGLTSVTLNEIIGPVLTRMALVKSGEAGKDRPRLIDFIHEENIITNLKAGSKEEAIERLADLLISSHQLKVDRDELLHTVFEREREAPSAVGYGFALPRGVLDGDGDMVGVMGLSPDGIPCDDAPDGKPLRCMVLLVTPSSQRDRHLEVLAALTHSIGSDPNIRRQLYAAKSPAHAYDIIHAEEFEDFNYFLESDD